MVIVAATSIAAIALTGAAPADGPNRGLLVVVVTTAVASLVAASIAVSQHVGLRRWQDAKQRRRVDRLRRVPDPIADMVGDGERLEQARRLDAIAVLVTALSRDLDDLCAAACIDAVPTSSDGGASTDVPGKIRNARLLAEAIRFELLGVRAVPPESVDLSALVRDMAPQLGRLAGRGHRVAISGAEDVRLFADRQQLERIITNLVALARDVTPCGGEMSLRIARIRQPGARERGSTIDAPEQVLVALHVGVEMSPSGLARTTEPHSGLMQALKDLGGCFDAARVEGCASRFQVFLPLGPARHHDCREPETRSPDAVAGSPEATADTERIRTHLTPALLHLQMYERSGGGTRHTESLVLALQRALRAAIREHARAHAPLAASQRAPTGCAAPRSCRRGVRR